MSKNVAVPLLAMVALVTVAGCASHRSTSPSAAVAAPADVSGTWTGSTISGAGGSPVTMTLTQTGNAVTGNLEVAGHGDISGPIEGTVEGNTIKLRGGTGTAPLLNVQGDRITGTVRGATLDLRRAR
jgi:hypothetical protein